MTYKLNNSFVEAINYITPLKYVSGRIVEYDIASANINMLYKYGKIDKSYYEYLSRLPKINREIEIGLLIKNDITFYNIIKGGIIEAKKNLFNYNQIDPASVVRIANDAVYINSSVDLQYTQFDNIIFKKKSESSSMIKLGDLVIFFDFSSDNISINVIGMKEDQQQLHSEYMLSIIANSIYLLEKYSVEDAMKLIENFINDYLNYRIDKRYYREFNSLSLYHYKNSDFLISDINKVPIKDIDINYNFYILRELWSVLLGKYQYKEQ